MKLNKSTAQGGLVYSTAHGKMCPGCRQPVARCICKQQKAGVPSDGIVRVRLETKGRKGKGVTVVMGIPVLPAALDAIGKELKQRCGSGGTVKDGVIEIQGDHRDTVVAELTKRGYTVKKAGGH
ncbi:translation initiation factor Sui1 [Methylolobus aquaticus]